MGKAYDAQAAGKAAALAMTQEMYGARLNTSASQLKSGESPLTEFQPTMTPVTEYSASVLQKMPYGISLEGGVFAGQRSADARGYTQNLSYQGTNTGGAGRRDYCAAGGGSYGAMGGGGALAGSSFGANDFWVNLYLGSGGADNRNWYDCYPDGNGGNGGGAISISAASISNAGVISARGQNSEFGGSGSGGTIVVNVSENFTNTGTISAAGGTTGVVGGNGRVKLVYSSGSSGIVIGEQ